MHNPAIAQEHINHQRPDRFPPCPHALLPVTSGMVRKQMQRDFAAEIC
jgi:hypothetical protein